MASYAETTLQRIMVKEVVEGRYAPGTRPVLWDQRRDGFDRIRAADGRELILRSSGGQSTPAPGWELMLTGEVESELPQQSAFEWTLFGIAPPHSIAG